MTLNVSWVLIAIAFLATMAVLFVIATALRKWVFELSPKEWGFTVVLSASLGALGTAYIDNDALIELLAGGVLAVAFLWWLVRLFWRHRARQEREEE